MEKAVRVSMYGTPGPVYIELTADVLFGKIENMPAILQPVPPVTTYLEKNPLSPEKVANTLALLKMAKKPLVIVGKGIAYADASEGMRSFLAKTNLPFLATPMGKGVVDDKDPKSVAAARTHVLEKSDVIFLCGARLNWMLHFGLPPRFN